MRVQKPAKEHKLEIPYQEMGDEKAPPVAKDGEPKKKFSLGRLMSQAGPEKCIITIATIALFLSAIFNLAVPAIVGVVIDAISVPDLRNSNQISGLTRLILDYIPREWDPQQSLLTVAVTGLGASIVLGSIFAFVRGYLFNLAGERVVARLRKRLFQAIVCQEVAFFDMTRTGELTNRLASDTEVLKDACTTNISMGLRWVSTIVGGLIYLFLISWKLSCVMLSVIPFVAIGARCYGMRIRTLSKDTQDALAQATTVAEESISNIRDVRAFSREMWQAGVYGARIDITYRLGARMALLYGIFIAMMGICGSGSMVLVLWYGARLVIDHEMSTGVLTSFVLYTITVAGALAGLSGLFGSLMKAVGANERVFELIDRQPRIPVQGGTQLEALQGRVTLQNVSFSYPARPDVQVLSNVNLDLLPGTVTALVGPSGGGKSTIVSLVERFYDLEGASGSVLFDGVDVRDLDPTWLHRRIGLVKQEPVLFATSIKENLLYGVESATQEEVEQAAKIASAHDFIQTFPEKYETMVGERGVRLSGGQKQRVAIARAVLMNPKILIADEATSSLDAESEFKVQEALDTLMKGRTVLMIAHRLSTVKNADNVLVVEGGKIVEEGTHDELLAKGGAYANLVRRQLTGSDAVGL